nr:hypothetical protein [Desulfobacula sp.]
MNRAPDTELNTVSVPDELHPVFLKAQDYVRNYFSEGRSDPEKGVIQYSGERYILVRASAMSKELFDMMALMYSDRGKDQARDLSFNFLFDIAHSIGKADAKSFLQKWGSPTPLKNSRPGPFILPIPAGPRSRSIPCPTPGPMTIIISSMTIPIPLRPRPGWKKAKEPISRSAS